MRSWVTFKQKHINFWNSPHKYQKKNPKQTSTKKIFQTFIAPPYFPPSLPSSLSLSLSYSLFLLFILFLLLVLSQFYALKFYDNVINFIKKNGIIKVSQRKSKIIAKFPEYFWWKKTLLNMSGWRVHHDIVVSKLHNKYDYIA